MGRQDTYGTAATRKEKRRKEAQERQALHNSLTTQQKIDKLKSRYTIRGPIGSEEMMSYKEYRRLEAQLRKQAEIQEAEDSALSQ